MLYHFSSHDIKENTQQFIEHIFCILEANRGAGAQSVTVRRSATGCVLK